jgi:Leucine-rich repeat (LRR) protein
LRSLNLWGTAISDLTPLQGLNALEALSLGGTAVSDLAPLRGLAALQRLYLDETAKPAKINALREALPNLEIEILPLF